MEENKKQKLKFIWWIFEHLKIIASLGFRGFYMRIYAENRSERTKVHRAEQTGTEMRVKRGAKASGPRSPENTSGGLSASLVFFLLSLSILFFSALLSLSFAFRHGLTPSAPPGSVSFNGSTQPRTHSRRIILQAGSRAMITTRCCVAQPWLAQPNANFTTKWTRETRGVDASQSQHCSSSARARARQFLSL